MLLHYAPYMRVLVSYRALCTYIFCSVRVECLILTLEPWDSCKQVSFFSYSFRDAKQDGKKSVEIFIYFTTRLQ